MLISSSEQHIKFLQESVIIPIRKILDENQTLFGFILMGQAIEILGSYLDDKPLRAKQQSASRFSLAIYKLFPSKYNKTNSKSFLYYQLRTCLIHMFIPTDKLSLNSGKSTKEKPHLLLKNEVLFLYSEDLFDDLKNATNVLIDKINLNQIKLKKISFGETNFYVNPPTL